MQKAIYPAPDGFKFRTAKAARRSRGARDVFDFLAAVPNNVIGSIHPRAWPAILTTREEIDLWMTMPLDDAVRPQRPLTLVALAGAVLNALMGLAQISGGPDSSLRFYEGNSTEAVGFFANRDHFAALLYASVPFVGAWVLSLSHDSLRRKASETQLNAFMALILGTCVSIILLVAEVMARSRAGIALIFVALVGAALLLWRERRSAGIVSGAGLVVAVIG
ncbi:MAG: hypothetical protein HZC06_07745, partial [Methylocystis sp.]|nr:hypothetical protein [Methylocystis sp.]